MSTKIAWLDGFFLFNANKVDEKFYFQQLTREMLVVVRQ